MQKVVRKDVLDKGFIELIDRLGDDHTVFAGSGVVGEVATRLNRKVLLYDKDGS